MWREAGFDMWAIWKWQNALCASSSSIHTFIHCVLTPTPIISLKLILPVFPPYVLVQPSLNGPIHLRETSSPNFLTAASYLPFRPHLSLPVSYVLMHPLTSVPVFFYVCFVPLLNRGPQTFLDIASTGEFSKLHTARPLQTLLWGQLRFLSSSCDSDVHQKLRNTALLPENVTHHHWLLTLESHTLWRSKSSHNQCPTGSYPFLRMHLKPPAKVSPSTFGVPQGDSHMFTDTPSP